jgi:hypothetical protein
MNPAQATMEELRKDYDELWQLFACYLCEDWPEEYGTWERAIDAAVLGRSRHIEVALRRLENLLALQLSSKDLRRVLGNLSCGYWPGTEEHYEPWLSEVAGRIRSTIGSRAS